MEGTTPQFLITLIYTSGRFLIVPVYETSRITKETAILDLP